MRRRTAAAVSLAWFTVIGGTFGCLLPYLLNYWHFHQPLPYWWIARVAGTLLICGGLIPLVGAFGAQYQAYRRAVPAWIPRLRPWTPGE